MAQMQRESVVGGENPIGRLLLEISYSVPNLANIPLGNPGTCFDHDNVIELEPVSEKDQKIHSSNKLRLVCQRVFDRGITNIKLELGPICGPIAHFDILVARMHPTSEAAPILGELFQTTPREGSSASGVLERVRYIENGTVDLLFHMPVSNYFLVPVKERLIQCHLCRDYSNLLSDTEHADVTIVVRGTEIKAHKCILASRSEYFSRMFASGMKENEANVIKVEDFDADTFRLALELLYAGFSPSLTFDSALQLLPLTNKYLFKNQYRDCLDFVAKGLSKENVEKAIQWAVEHKNEELQTYCFRVMKQKMSEKERWGILYNLDKDIVGKFFSILE